MNLKEKGTDDRTQGRACFPAINKICAVIEDVDELTKCLNHANIPLLTEEGWLRQ